MATVHGLVDRVGSRIRAAAYPAVQTSGPLLVAGGAFRTADDASRTLGSRPGTLMRLSSRELVAYISHNPNDGNYVLFCAGPRDWEIGERSPLSVKSRMLDVAQRTDLTILLLPRQPSCSDSEWSFVSSLASELTSGDFEKVIDLREAHMGENKYLFDGRRATMDGCKILASAMNQPTPIEPRKGGFGCTQS